jgi:hypothetical protein
LEDLLFIILGDEVINSTLIVEIVMVGLIGGGSSPPRARFQSNLVMKVGLILQMGHRKGCQD